MIRLILLLLGARPLRARWGLSVVMSIACLLAGLMFIGDVFDGVIIVTTDVIGALLVIEGLGRLLALAAIGFPNATVPVVKALGFFALGFVAIDLPWDDNIVATIVLGAALAVDGLFRLVATGLIRSVRWRQAVATGILELVMAGVVWAPGQCRTGIPSRSASASHSWPRPGASSDLGWNCGGSSLAHP